jgi:hypothetical protein
MLKLNASFSKKVPAELDYSSQSYHASVEVELPDGLTPPQLQQRIHETFSLVRDSVETEIGVHSNNATGSVQRDDSGPASEKQKTYLFDLAKQNGANVTDYLRDIGLNSVKDLTRNQCSGLIDKLKQRAA